MSSRTASKCCEKVYIEMPQRLFFYNTDVGSTDGVSRAYRLLQRNCAVTGDTEKFASQLKQLSPGDLLLMYENGTGVIAVGEVKEYWNGIKHPKSDYYLAGGEARIKVDWFNKLDKNPIPLSVIRECTSPGWTPRGTIRRIEKYAVAVRACIEKHDDCSLPSPKASDADTSPGRTEVTISRIVRDTSIARMVRAMNDHRCQLCPTLIIGPDGLLYAEVHHIQPLGGEHRGPDAMENLICVCPNCHAMLDLGFVRLNPRKIKQRDPRHVIADRFIDYHNTHIYRV